MSVCVSVTLSLISICKIWRRLIGRWPAAGQLLRSYWSNRRPRRSLGCTINVLYCIVLYCTVRVGVRGTLISRSTRIWRDFYLAVQCFVSPDKSVHSSHVSRDSETKFSVLDDRVISPGVGTTLGAVTESSLRIDW